MSINLLCGRFEFSLERPLVMGILNVTPDSFSDGSRHLDTDAAIAHGMEMVQQGADIIDIGAESTRPGAIPVTQQQEIDRLLPVIEGLRECGAAISVDTFKPEVMQGMLKAGVDMINDVYGFRQPGALEAVAPFMCGLCVMHMQGEPRTMQQAPYYDDVVGEVREFLRERVAEMRTLGMHPQRILLDPGFGFGKSATHNYELLRRLPELFFDDYPWLVALSRKTMIGQVTGREPDQRLGGSIAGALAGVSRGAAMVRVHDVAQTVDALKVWNAIKNGVSDESA